MADECRGSFEKCVEDTRANYEGGLMIELPELLKMPELDVKPLWESDRYDGTISGVCEYQERKYWFTWIDEKDKDYEAPRTYAVIELSDEQIKWVEYWHEEFRKYVGTHTDFEGGTFARVDAHGVKPQSEWNKFYDRYKLEQKRDYSGNKIIGWFEER